MDTLLVGGVALVILFLASRGGVRMAKGYRKGREVTLTLVEIQPGHYLDAPAAAAFKAMEAAAARDGVKLVVSSSFRDMAKQQALWSERMNPDGTPNETGKRIGIAARPGYSNHQGGTAVDLNTGGMVYGPVNGVFRWLLSNASKYGFHNTVASEAWHWDWLGGN